MTMNGAIYCSNVNNTYLMPEWVRSERYEYCENFYENYTTDKGHGILARLALVLTALFN